MSLNLENRVDAKFSKYLMVLLFNHSTENCRLKLNGYERIGQGHGHEELILIFKLLTFE